MQRTLLLGVGALIIIAGLIIGFLVGRSPTPPPVETPTIQDTPPETPGALTETRVIGASVEGRPLEMTTYGTGETHILFVGGVHGGYEWNSVLLAYAFMDHLEQHPEFVPPHMRISVIPVLNPDGLFDVTGIEGRFEATDIPTQPNTQGTGRFNARGVDLNRNFDCKWHPESSWRGAKVSAGTEAFSEPEAAALRDVVLGAQPAAVIFWHSQASAVYASECLNGILPQTMTIMESYARAAGYQAIPVFDAYPITGDAEGWLASIGIPAITVELETRNSIEWNRNIAGISAMLATFAAPDTE